MTSSSLEEFPDGAALDHAFESLKTYGPGSGRAALLPLDHAAAQAGNDSKLRKELEGRLLTALKGCESTEAREYICSKLALVGSSASVSALAALLSEPIVACPARNAMEAIPGAEAGKALRASLPKLIGPLQLGAINSLGVRRDEASVRALATLLRSPDEAVAAAAAAALGRIGTSKAAKALRAFQPHAPSAMGAQIADALLVCAEQLLAGGHKTEARSLYALLEASILPRHVRDAARNGMRACLS